MYYYVDLHIRTYVPVYTTMLYICIPQGLPGNIGPVGPIGEPGVTGPPGRDVCT